MHWFYFTFGSDRQFPYPNSYMKIKAKNRNQAIYVFMAYHPNRPGSEAYNASDSYTQEQWDEFAGKYYANQEPAAVVEYKYEENN